MIDIEVRRASKKVMLELPQMIMDQPWRRHSSAFRFGAMSAIPRWPGENRPAAEVPKIRDRS